MKSAGSFRSDKRFAALEKLHQRRELAREDEVYELRLNEAIQHAQKDLEKVQKVVLAWESGNKKLERSLKRTEELLLLAYLRAKKNFSGNDLKLEDVLLPHIWFLAFSREENRALFHQEGLLGSYEDYEKAVFDTPKKVFEPASLKSGLNEIQFKQIWDEIDLVRVHLSECVEEFQSAIQMRHLDQSYLFWKRVEIALWSTSALFLVGRAILYTGLGPIGWAILAADIVATTAFLAKNSYELSMHQRTGSTSGLKDFETGMGTTGRVLDSFLWVHMLVGLGSWALGSRSLRGFLARRARLAGDPSQLSIYRRLSAYHRLYNRQGRARHKELEKFTRAFKTANEAYDFMRTTQFIYQDVNSISSGEGLQWMRLLRRARRYNIFRKTIYKQSKPLFDFMKGSAYVGR